MLHALGRLAGSRRTLQRAAGGGHDRQLEKNSFNPKSYFSNQFPSPGENLLTLHYVASSSSSSNDKRS